MAGLTVEERIALWKPVASQLLPQNSTPLEKAMLTAELARLSLYKPEIVQTIWDPWTCPLPLLPFLAWSLSVDVWDNSWSEERKRRAVAASPEIHRRKGTRLAVEKALDVLDIESVVKEWWEEVPEARRGTFRLDLIYRNGSPAFDAEIQTQAIAAAQAAKPKSRTMTTRLVLEARGALSVAATSSVAMLWEALPPEFDPPELTAELPVAASSQHHFLHEAS